MRRSAALLLICGALGGVTGCGKSAPSAIVRKEAQESAERLAPGIRYPHQKREEAEVEEYRREHPSLAKVEEEEAKER